MIYIYYYISCHFRYYHIISLHVDPVFITEPNSVNVSEGKDAKFTCIGVAFGHFWLINGMGLFEHDHRNITTHPSETLSGGANSYTLTILGLPVNDNISIECVLLPTQGPSIISQPAYLRVQGTRKHSVGVLCVHAHQSVVN